MKKRTQSPIGLTRRGFLHGMGAGALASLGGLRWSRASSATPCRFVFVIEGNCVEPAALLSEPARAALDASNTKVIGSSRWWYNGYQHGTPIEVEDAALETAPALGSLAGSAGLPSLLEKSAVVYGLSNRIAGGGHSSFSGGLSCTRPARSVPNAITIDAYLAALPQVVGATPFDAVRLGVTPISSSGAQRLDFGVCAYGPNRAAPLLTDPVDGFGFLFSSVGDAAQQAAFERRSELLEFAQGATNDKLSCFKGGAEEKAKLAEYLIATEALLARQSTLLTMAPTLNAVKPENPGEDNLLKYSSTSHFERLQAQFALVEAALVGGLTNVAVVGIGTGERFDFPNPGKTSLHRHDLHHQSGGSASLVNTIHSISGDYISMVAGLARTLDAIGEGSGTMLDHTVIVYMGDNGEQHHSTGSEWPVLLIGGGALGLQTGNRTVVFPGLAAMAHQHLSNLFVTFAGLAGDSIDTFGNDSTAPLGPLPELLA